MRACWCCTLNGREVGASAGADLLQHDYDDITINNEPLGQVTAPGVYSISAVLRASPEEKQAGRQGEDIESHTVHTFVLQYRTNGKLCLKQTHVYQRRCNK